MSKENPNYWGFEGDEIVYHETIEDLLQDFVDKIPEGEPIPETVEVEGFDWTMVCKKTVKLSDFDLDY